jgi:restriction endonuclease S subunit
MYDTGNLSNPQLQMQQQITDILKTIDKLRGLSRMARLAKLQTLKSRVKLAEVKARKLALQERRDAMIQHAMETRRAELSLIHPWGWARDLGLNISDYSLEKAAKLKETVYHADRHPTYLDNPMRLALMRELVYG